MAWPLILSSVVEVVKGHYGAYDDSKTNVDDHVSLEEGRRKLNNHLDFL